MTERRQAYPHASVVLVAVEVRHPSVEPLTDAQKLTIKRSLSTQFPILKSGQLTTLQGIIGTQTAPEVRVEEFPRYLSRDNTTAASIRDESLVIESTHHLRWGHLRELLANVLRARHEATGIDGVERVGLRYINEIRVPDDPAVPDDPGQGWTRWVDGTLLGPVNVGQRLGLRPLQWSGTSVFTSGPDRTVTLRYGPREGYAVDPGGILKRPTPAPGPFFLLDIDSFWTPSEGIPEFDVDQLRTVCDELHEPVRELFERLITDHLREEVLCDVE